MRVCNLCNVEKSEEDFYTSNRTRCKECVKARARAHRNANIERYQAYDRARGFRSGASPKEHIAARGKVRRALKSGRLKKPVSCQRCGFAITELEAHHEDYSKPLEVMWLCSTCHGLRHREINEERRAA